jgi:hypothetical protein
MSSSFSVPRWAALAALVAVGAGCAVQPRVVRTPTPVAPQVVVTSSSTVPEVPVAQLAVVGYLRVGPGASATLQRGDAFPAEAKDGTELQSGDRVAAKSGDVEVVYPDAGVTRLDPGADVQLVAREASADGSSVAAQLELFAGRAWTRFERVFGSGEEFSVEANGVVATVRGTGFGVVREADGSVDIQVADHAVEVSSQADDEKKWAEGKSKNALPVFGAGERIRLSAGQALKIPARRAAGFLGKAKGSVRELTPAERKLAGFVFAQSFLPSSRSRRPDRPVRLPSAPSLPSAVQRRVQFLRDREELRKKFPDFQAPTTAPSLQVETKATLIIQ